MSLRSLSDEIQFHNLEMERQRRSALLLLQRQKRDVQRQLGRIPLPAAIGAAVIGGFVAQRLLKTLPSKRLLRFYLTWRTL